MENLQEQKNIFQLVMGYVNILLKGWKLIFLTTFIFGFVSVSFGVLTLFLPPEKNPMPNTYTSRTELLLSSGNSNDMLSLLSGGSFGGSGRVEDTAQMLISLLNSNAVVDLIIENINLPKLLNIPPDTEKKQLREYILRKRGINFDVRSKQITIAVVDRSPERAKLLTEANVQGLTQWLTEFGGTQSAKHVRLLEKTLLEIETKIASLETQISEFQQRYGALTIQEIAESQNEMLNYLRSRLVELELELKNYRSFTRVNDSTALRLQSERDNILEQIRLIESGVVDGVQKYPPKSQLPSLALEFSKLQIDREIQQKLYQTISERYEIARLSAAEEIPFHILEPAEVPQEKSGPNRKDMVIKATMMGFALGVAIILLRHLWAHIKANPEKYGLPQGGKKT